MLAQYRKFVFDAKKYQTAKFSSFKSGEDRLDSFLGRNITDASRISGFLVNSAATSYIIT